jgi:hypothetical protein
LNSSGPKLSDPIDKNAIIAEYNMSCQKQGINNIVSTHHLSFHHPTRPRLLDETKSLCLDNVIVELVKSPESFLTNEDAMNLSKVNSLYREMIHDVIDLRLTDFTKMKEPRIRYAEQTAIYPTRVNMATACAIHYSLHPGMVIRYLKSEYFGENRDVNQILSDVSPFIDETDAAHIKLILTQGCPSKLSFKEMMIMKASIIQKGNQATFKMHPEAVTKTMNKEDRHSHLLPVKLWILHFLPWCRHTAQGMQIKPGKNPRVIFDASTKSHPHKIVLNDMTPLNLKLA